MVVAAVVTGVAFVAGVWDEPELKQSLCGLPRADKSPLGVVLPKGRRGVETREVSEMSGHGKVLCVISVDGEGAVTVLMFGQDPNRPTSTDTTGMDTRKMIAKGVVASLGGASQVDYCPGTRDLAAFVTVMSDPATWPESPAEQAAHTRALASLAATVLAEQRHEVCY
ncbi:hypothetical protein [Kitasatospora sp. NPDC092286]|uniref:hypothetical protein n=1 Tax=Kitasatospora sp. NPDC092286 TaxID=3364087 RepID=UPI003801D1D6